MKLIKILCLSILALINVACMSLFTNKSNYIKTDFDVNKIDTLLVFKPTSMIFMNNTDHSSVIDGKIGKTVEEHISKSIQKYLKIPTKDCRTDELTQRKLDTLFMRYKIFIEKDKKVEGYTLTPILDKVFKENNSNYAIVLGDFGMTGDKDPSKVNVTMGVGSGYSDLYCIVFDRRNNKIIYFANKLEEFTEPAIDDVTDSQVKKILQNLFE